MRQLRVRMPDDTIRSVMVDEHQPVANLMVIVCTKLGITNHDEYSLIATGKHTINGRRRERLEGRIIDQKMEQLKKKLKTDEDLAWVDHSKTLGEQDIHEQDVFLLRRRFFYSDHNVDSRDPLQLGLLYVQTRDAILSGTHPVTLDGACRFAGLQCQAQLGDFQEGKTTRPGYLQPKDYLPQDYAKSSKQVVQKIHQEHKKFYGLGELEAKARYVQEARALPTYGVTFFLVKEKVPGKNKLVPRLLGITKDCVMRVDADSKAILKTWPLTTVKRWAASMNSFTLDFGDYSQTYYSVQTTEGEQISQLIAGYIDIILRRRKAKDHFGIEGDEGATMIEDSVAPSRATIIQNQPALRSRPPSAAPSMSELRESASLVGPQVERYRHAEGPYVEPPDFRPAVEVRGKAEIGYEARPPTQYVASYEPSPPQRDLQERLEQAQEAVEQAQKVLDHKSSATTTTTTTTTTTDRRQEEQTRRKLSNQFAEINAATAQLVSLSAIPEEELDYPELNKAVQTVATHLPAVAQEVRSTAARMEDEEEGERLVDAARRLCKAFSDLLNAAEPGPTVPRQSLISAASRVGDATQALLYAINGSSAASSTLSKSHLSASQQQLERRELEEERERADLLLSLAKSVASAAAALVLKAKDVASTCRHDEALENQVIGSATQCALATSQMVATAKIVAPTIKDANCQRKLVDACQEVERAVKGIRQACRQALGDDQARLCDLEESVGRANDALDELLDHVRLIKHRQTTTTTTTRQVTSTTSSHQHHQHHHTNTSQLEREDGPEEEEEVDPAKSELVQQARTLARATAQLCQDIRPLDGSHPPPKKQHHLEQQVPIQRELDKQQQHYRELASQRELADQLERERQQQTSTTTTTITTTVYDEQRDQLAQQHQREQQQLQHQQQERPVSLYEQQHQEEVIHTETLSSQQQEDGSSELPEATISGIVGDLETTIMFATAGTLRAHDQHDSYLYHREQVLRCAKALVEDTRPLVASAASDQRQLAQAAQESVLTMARLAETVKSSAASLGPNNAEAQVGLIRSVKEVAVSLADLIGSTKSALGCEPHDSRLVQVKDSAKSMVSSVTSLLKTVKSVEDEQQRGIRAIEAALEAIEQELAQYETNCSTNLTDPASSSSAASSQANEKAAADELTRISRPVTMATAKTVHAASSGLQDDAIVAANMGRKAILDLLATTSQVVSRGVAANNNNNQAQDSWELRQRIQEAGRSCAVQYKHLLELLHRIFQHPSIASANPDFKQELISQSKIIASCVLELESCSQQQSLIISQRKVPGIAQEISACEQILRKEKELEVAKTQLLAIRKAKYSNRPDDYQGYGGSLD